MMRDFSWHVFSIIAGLGIACGCPTVAQADAPNTSALSLQGGWWSAEGEWKTSSGIYAAVGVPWVGLWLMPGRTVPFAARVGYQYDLSSAWALRGSARLAGTSGEASCGCQRRVIQTFGFVELGIRYQAPSGFVAGLDLPLLGFDQAHDLARGRTEGVELFPPPLSLAFSQAYVGYAWKL
jgi:hypothetical protein